ncbi:MAG: hypothetical protein WCH39_08065, partial [Schlesneria sp.]
NRFNASGIRTNGHFANTSSTNEKSFTALPARDRDDSIGVAGFKALSRVLTLKPLSDVLKNQRPGVIDRIVTGHLVFAKNG